MKPAAGVTTSQKPFFDPGASTSSLARETSGPSLVQATGEAVEEMQTATQPLEAPGAGTATQPVQAPVQSLMYSHPVREISVQHLIVRVTSTMLPVPYLMRTTGTGHQTETSPRKRLQIRNIQRRQTTERQ